MAAFDQNFLKPKIIKTITRTKIIKISDADRARFPRFQGNETHTVVHKYCDPPRITPDRKTCLPWKDNWHKVDSIKKMLFRKGLSNRINEKCSNINGIQKCTFDDEIFYDFMKLGWAKDTEDGKDGICGLIDRPVSECIQAGLRIFDFCHEASLRASSFAALSEILADNILVILPARFTRKI